MKILFITPLPPPVTGQSLAVQVFYDELIKNHQIEVVNLSKTSFKSGINSFKRVVEILKILYEVWRKKKGADVLYFTISESIAGNIKDICIYLICYKNLANMLIHLHGGAGMRTIMRDAGSLLCKINKFFVRKLGGVIVLGQAHVNIYADSVPNKKIHIVPNFAEDYLFLPEEEIQNKFNSTRPIRFLFLSNLIPGKGYIELLNAYFALDAHVKEKVSIDFAGGFESEIQKLEFLARISENDNLRYHGIVGGAEKKALFAHAHVFCLPTYYPYEGQPICILEAYAAGCAVLTTDHSGICDVFKNKVNGFEVEKKSADSIKSAVECIIKEPELLLSMAMFNRKLANERYLPSIYNAALLKIIEGLK